jgi:hypothetical protein
VESVTITSSIVAPHGPTEVPVKVSVVVVPEPGASAAPRDVAAQFMLFGSPVEVNVKLLLGGDPNCTVMVLVAGEFAHGPNKPPAIGLPAIAQETEYTCPGWVGMFWDSGAFGPLGLMSRDWFP